MFFWVTFCGTCYAEPVTAALIIGGTALAGSGISAFANWKGMKGQIREDRRTEAAGLKLRGEEIAREEKYRKQDIAFRGKQFKASEEQRKYNNAMNLTNKMWEQSLMKPQLQKNLLSIWRGRRAA